MENFEMKLEGFQFYLRGFSTRYQAIPNEQCYDIFAGDEKVTFFEAGELRSMIERQVIVKAYEEVVQ